MKAQIHRREIVYVCMMKRNKEMNKKSIVRGQEIIPALLTK